jgi:hypothetical protein
MKLALAVGLTVLAVAVAVADAPLLHRERVWLLTLTSVAPALLALLVARRAFVFSAAATLPAILRFAFGDRSEAAAFDRLALNPLWFVLLWLPLAAAFALLTGPRTNASERATFFGRRLWRPATACLLLVVAATFASKRAVAPWVLAVDGALSVTLLIAGIGLLVSDLVPPRGQFVALQWTSMVLVVACAVFTMVAASNWMDVRRDVRHAEDDAESAVVMRQSILEIAARYEKRGALTNADRAHIRARTAELELERRDALASAEDVRSNLPPAIGLTVLAAAATFVFILGAFRAHRIRAMKRALVVLLLATSAFAAAPKKPFSVVEATIPDMQAALREKRITSRELVTLYLIRIATYEDRLNAIITVNPHALEDADRLDRERTAGKVRGPLHGIPSALKDNIHTTDRPTTGGAL